MIEIALGVAAGTVLTLISLGLYVRWKQESYIRKATGLTKAQRELNREVARGHLALLHGYTVVGFAVEEDGYYSYTRLHFDNDYTLTVAAAHGHLVTSVQATEDEVAA